jgi:hypothetical protein
MDSTQKLGDIVLGSKDCKIIGHLARICDSRNMRSRIADSHIIVDGLIINKDVSFFGLSNILLSSIFAHNFEM